MRKPLFLPGLCACLVCLAFARSMLEDTQAVRIPASPQRIVSLAPSVTETLYALGFGDGVVGVTTWCAWPEDAKEKAKIADYAQINLEALIRVQPDLAVVPADKPHACALLEKLGIPVLTLTTQSLEAYVDAMKALGERMGHQAEAAAIEANFRRELAAAAQRAAGKSRPRVLFSIMHSEEGLGSITEINVVGQDSFYSDLLEAAGGKNVYEGALPFPRLSREAVLFLNPDVIVDIIRPGDNARAVRQDWNSMPDVRAIRDGRLVLLAGVEDTVPGPRSALTLARLSKAFYPDEAPDTASGKVAP